MCGLAGIQLYPTERTEEELENFYDESEDEDMKIGT